MTEIELPAWASKKENYAPDSDRDFFLSRSLLRVLATLFALRSQARQSSSRQPAGTLLLVLSTVLLTVSAQSGAFLLCVLAGELAVLAALPTAALRRCLQNALLAAFFSGLVLLPTLLWGGSRALFLIPAKTFLTVTCLSLLSQTLPWHQLTASLRFFRLPPLIIFILDLTLKYIVLLGEVSAQLLWALKLRSVGRNPVKQQAFSGVLGTTFLRSRQLSADMYDAMRCRGFTGEYPAPPDPVWQRRDWLALLPALGLVLLYLYLEGVLL